MTAQRPSNYGTIADHPALAAQFDVAANGGRTADQVTAGGKEKSQWACPVAPDHRWRPRGGERLKGYGCPARAGKQVSITNSVAAHPELVAFLANPDLVRRLEIGAELNAGDQSTFYGGTDAGYIDYPRWEQVA